MNNTYYCLDQLYDLNIIFPKYRYFAAVTTFYEYFSSGRCSSLTGHEGAYNLYENELRMGIIINKLDRIVQMLGQIQQNQYTLATAIQESNQKADRIFGEICRCEERLETLNNNVVVNGYFNAISAMNSISIAKYIRQ